jgi:hypothetical protein
MYVRSHVYAILKKEKKKTFTVETIPKFYRTILETEARSILPNTYIHDP